MREKKKLLALLLTFALAFGLASPAMAEVIWDDFIIITQPQDLTVLFGETFTLSVEVNIPDGAKEEYQWFLGRTPIEGATGPALSLGSTDETYPSARNPWDNAYAYYSCKITADDGSETQTRTSDSVRVTVEGREKTTEEKARDVFVALIAEPFLAPLEVIINGFLLMCGLVVFSKGIERMVYLPLAIVWWPLAVFVGPILGISVLIYNLRKLINT